jgi:CelD/BcsL family acetyltransferase involved in cellulose biosynthesis
MVRTQRTASVPSVGLSATVHVAESLEELDPFLGGWDRLAEDNGQPLGRPDWLLEWWRARSVAQQAPGGLRVTVVCDAQGVAGVAPMFVEDTQGRVAHWRFLGQRAFYGVGPLVRSEGADRTIGLIARAIASSRRRPGIVFIEGVDVDCSWPEALARSWPGRRAWIRGGARTRALSVRLDGTFDDWLRGRGRGWPGDYRRRRRRLLERGAVVRRAQDAEDVNGSLAALMRLHHARWEHRSAWLNLSVERTLGAASERLAARDAFRLWLVEIDGRVIGASAFAVAGGALSMLMTAYDPEWRPFAPGLVSILAGIKEAFQLGDQVIDLSFGTYPYKLRLANEVRWIRWCEMFPRDRRYPLARAHALPSHGREAVDRARARVQARTRLAEARTRVGQRVGRGLGR